MNSSRARLYRRRVCGDDTLSRTNAFNLPHSWRRAATINSVMLLQCCDSLLLCLFKRTIVHRELRDAARELLPTLHNDVRVSGIEFHQACIPAAALTGDERRAGTTEQVCDAVSSLAAVT